MYGIRLLEGKCHTPQPPQSAARPVFARAALPWVRVAWLVRWGASCTRAARCAAPNMSIFADLGAEKGEKSMVSEHASPHKARLALFSPCRIPWVRVTRLVRWGASCTRAARCADAKHVDFRGIRGPIWPIFGRKIKFFRLPLLKSR